MASSNNCESSLFSHIENPVLNISLPGFRRSKIFFLESPRISFLCLFFSTRVCVAEQGVDVNFLETWTMGEIVLMGVIVLIPRDLTVHDVFVDVTGASIDLTGACWEIPTTELVDLVAVLVSLSLASGQSGCDDAQDGA